jgi:hypothetical protein
VSSYGRCQDALWGVYERDHFDGTEDGPAKRLGVTRDQWRKLIPEILDAVYPIAHEQGVRYAEYMREREIK